MTDANLENLQSTGERNLGAGQRQLIGVYEIKCRESGKSYIGWSSNVHSRIGWHRSHLRTGKHSRREMQNDFIAYGEIAFSFTLLVACDDEAQAVREEALRIGESFKAGLSYNGIVPNAADAKARAKRGNSEKAIAAPQQARANNLGAAIVFGNQKRLAEIDTLQETVREVMWYLNFRSDEQFLRLIDAFLKLTGMSEESLSLLVTGYPKFIFALRRPESPGCSIRNGRKFHDHILHFMEERDRRNMEEFMAARKAALSRSVAA